MVFHPKLIPWFVSDVTPADFKQTITSLLDPDFFLQLIKNSPAVLSEMVMDHPTHLASRWMNYLDNGTFSLAIPMNSPLGGGKYSALEQFWIGPWPYWDMQLHAPELFSELKKSDLVVFKGDLNYRKLTGDVLWPAWTPFSTALGPLAGSFPILSLRTNKATVVVGIDKKVAESLDDSNNRWRSNGRYALISFLEAFEL